MIGCSCWGSRPTNSKTDVDDTSSKRQTDVKSKTKVLNKCCSQVQSDGLGFCCESTCSKSICSAVMAQRARSNRVGLAIVLDSHQEASNDSQLQCTILLITQPQREPRMG